MGLKQYVRYQIDFFGKWVTVTGALMGLSVFLRMLHFFGLNLITDFDAGTVFLHLVLPVFLCACFVVLLNCVHWNAPGMYGILGAAFCLLFIGWNFSCGDFPRIILSVVGYLSAGLILLATTGGFVPGRFLAFLLFAILFFVRLYLYDLGSLQWLDWIPECADLCIIGSLAFLPFTLKPGKQSQPEE